MQRMQDALRSKGNDPRSRSTGLSESTSSFSPHNPHGKAMERPRSRSASSGRSLATRATYTEQVKAIPQPDSRGTRLSRKAPGASPDASRPRPETPRPSQSQSSKAKFCTNCGKKFLKPAAKFCAECGAAR
eukprot:NODE_3315_length_788_cov_54.834912_g2772_i0.p2 GENE.NODE_3315_length_788_cov_54.834912_g2772_i0~~NODE_3315_length_788_cov_54.834912_g2772_i0.p2  ORF type:complete len:131 (+),score=20.30 NODE_3315_length_788_cov_54.834912_g2772_i0:252-644(+)